MIEGQRIVERPPEQVMDRLRLAMSGANCEITNASDTSIAFRHGTYLTQSAPLLPKRGRVDVSPSQTGSRISYKIEATGFSKYWLIAVAAIFCWTIFPPILAYRTLSHHPRQLMESLLQGI